MKSPTTTTHRDLAPLIALGATMSRRDPAGFLAVLRVAATVARRRRVLGPCEPYSPRCGVLLSGAELEPVLASAAEVTA